MQYRFSAAGRGLSVCHMCEQHYVIDCRYSPLHPKLCPNLSKFFIFPHTLLQSPAVSALSVLNYGLGWEVMLWPSSPTSRSKNPNTKSSRFSGGTASTYHTIPIISWDMTTWWEGADYFVEGPNLFRNQQNWPPGLSSQLSIIIGFFTIINCI